jgi:Arc/MetJ-type ribon-helix-helix transcriptional regulator
METISIRFDEDFVHDMEKVMKGHRYSTKTEFIREAVRDKIEDLEKAEAMKRALKLYGAGRKKGRNITDADIHKAREAAAKDIAKELGVKLD